MDHNKLRLTGGIYLPDVSSGDGGGGRLWMKLCPLKDGEVLTPRPCKYDLIWKENFAYDQVKMRSIGRVLIQCDYVLIKGGILTQGKCHVKMEADMEVMHVQAKEHQRVPANCWKLGERPGTDSPSQPS